MDKALLISHLYAWVLHNDMKRHNVDIEDIKKGIERMKEVYNHKTCRLTSESADTADFNSPAYRCAYLHKYAPLHTVLVADLVRRIVYHNYYHFYDLVINSGCVNLCSLGGGPGSDIIGIILPLHQAFGAFQVSTNVIDCMPHWNSTFNSLIKETQQDDYGELGYWLSAQYFNWNYIGADLLEEFDDQVLKAISSADIINMIKFISAALCANTPSMVQKIFKLMKPGALALFIDNSVGDVKHILTKAAQECKLVPFYGPISHEHYVNRFIENTRFGYPSCFQTKIAIQVWMKPYRTIQQVNCSRVQRWVSFEETRRKSLKMNEIQSTPINPSNKSRIPLPDVVKSLQFDCTDESDYISLDDTPNFENSSFADQGEHESFYSDSLIPSQNNLSLNGNYFFENSFHEDVLPSFNTEDMVNNSTLNESKMYAPSNFDSGYCSTPLSNYGSRNSSSCVDFSAYGYHADRDHQKWSTVDLDNRYSVDNFQRSYCEDSLNSSMYWKSLRDSQIYFRSGPLSQLNSSIENYNGQTDSGFEYAFCDYNDEESYNSENRENFYPPPHNRFKQNYRSKPKNFIARRNLAPETSGITTNNRYRFNPYKVRVNRI